MGFHAQKVRKAERKKTRKGKRRNIGFSNTYNKSVKCPTWQCEKKIQDLQTQLNTHEPSSSSYSSSPPQPATQLKDIREEIFNYAVELHDSYKSKSKKVLSDKQLEAMANGLSCILDLEGDAQSRLLSEQKRSKIVSKYTSRFTMPLVPISGSYKNKWNYIAQLLSKSNGFKEARKFLYQLKLNDITEHQERAFDFLLNNL
jgi:hypothetical protein